jgi:hypothetical protein
LSTTAKARVIAHFPEAQLDFYEHLRGQRKPCWFIRTGIQCPAISGINVTPRQAWADADRLIREGKIKLVQMQGKLQAVRL